MGPSGIRKRKYTIYEINENYFFRAKPTTTYINMQDAYAVEKNELGTWKVIGYTGPGSNSASGSETGIFRYLEGESAPQWTVTTLQTLNDCSKDQDNAWQLGAKLADDSEQGQGSVLYQADGEDDCEALTPSFVNLHSGRHSDGT